MLKVLIIGGVSSTKRTLSKLIEHEINIVGVFGLELLDTTSVSGYTSMKELALKHNMSYFPFKKINDKINIDLIRGLKPDIIFVIGLSQLISQDLIKIAKKGVIGFHPTLLPRGRGRAPVAWIVLNERFGAANFFQLGDGVDDGYLFVQAKFKLEKDDDASTVEYKLLEAIDRALDIWLPKLKRGEWNPVPQKEDEAFEYARRAPLDGIIDWSNSALAIDKLIKASTRPHPGAFTFYNDRKLIIWNSSIERTIDIIGVVGRVLRIENGKLLVQTGDGLLWIEKFEIEGKIPIVGSRLGYYNQYEIYKIKNELNVLKERIDELTKNK